VQVVTTSHSFNATLVRTLGAAISTEARAFYNSGRHAGLTYWAPNINIFRDPRCPTGRISHCASRVLRTSPSEIVLPVCGGPGGAAGRRHRERTRCGRARMPLLWCRCAHGGSSGRFDG
jgi:hypothetical protein